MASDHCSRNLIAHPSFEGAQTSHSGEQGNCGSGAIEVPWRVGAFQLLGAPGPYQPSHYRVGVIDHRPELRVLLRTPGPSYRSRIRQFSRIVPFG